MLRRTASGSCATSKPATRPRPEVGVSSPHSIRMVVDFPAPFGPRKPKISPLGTFSETWSTATKSPNVFTRSSISTAQPFRLIALPHAAFASQLRCESSG